MSTLSKTPDDKMHRYLQRIQKLVGHRAKSPGLIKSRNKSPINVKASRVSVEPKQQSFVKSIVSVFSRYNQDNLSQFFCNFVETYQVRQIKRRDSQYSKQNYWKTVKKQNDQPLAVRFMVKALQRNTLDLLRLLFDSLKAYQLDEQPQQLTRDIKKSLKHRRTYSQIYAQSLSKSQSKSPATSQRYEYQTPSVVKIDNSVHLKKVQARLIAILLRKVFYQVKQNTFSQIKSFYCKSLSLDINQSRHFLSRIEQKFTSLKNQQQKTVQQLKKANEIIVEQQKVNRMKFSSLQRIKQQSVSKNEDDPVIENLQMQRILQQTRAVLGIYEIFNRKILICLAFGIERIKMIKKVYSHKYAKYFALSNTLKYLWNGRKKHFLTNLFQYVQNIKQNQESQKSLLKTESRQLITQRVLTPTHLTHQTTKFQSMQSSKHSRSSQKSNASNFDMIAKKINSAFELKATLRQIYSFGFQKIDEAAFIYMTLLNPISKLTRITYRQSFRKILFYSFYRSQSDKKFSSEFKPFTDSKPLSQSKLMAENKPPMDGKPSILKVPHSIIAQPKKALKNYENMSLILKKLQTKIVFMKIEAYSVLKLNSELKELIKIPEDVVISQQELKKQIKEFLFQRNKMHQKTSDTWHKTKQMLQQNTQSSTRSSLNTRIKT